MVKNIRELFLHISESLKEYTPDTYSFEAFELLEYAVGVKKFDYPLYADKTVSEDEIKKVQELLERRLGGEPLQYILGKWEFYGLPFKVGEGVLIPRADTETIADKAIELTEKYGYKIGADLCSGSGALGIALEKNSNIERVYAVELSDKAFPYLRENIELNKAERVIPVNEDIFTWEYPQNLDIIVSNPPYIPTLDIENLEVEVKKEPVMALDGGEDGLYFYREISKRFYNCLKSGGALVFEIGINQCADVMNIMKEIGYTDVNYSEDLCGIPRCVWGIK